MSNTALTNSECPQFGSLEAAIRLPITHIREKVHAIDGCMKHCGEVRQNCSEIIHDSNSRAEHTEATF
ncbi:MAG: hypothetical protein PHH70_05500 [Candidatus Gracilibacteria bacterium]|nr:hypothetical protein [Candidatus Gracilibacteria bacterium]